MASSERRMTTIHDSDSDLNCIRHFAEGPGARRVLLLGLDESRFDCWFGFGQCAALHFVFSKLNDLFEAFECHYDCLMTGTLIPSKPRSLIIFRSDERLFLATRSTARTKAVTEILKLLKAYNCSRSSS